MSRQAAFNDGRASMRFVFVSLIQRISLLSAGPGGRLTDEKAAAMSHLEWTADPWTRGDAAFKKEMATAASPKREDGSKKSADEIAYARYAAVLASLKEAKMLDGANVPWDTEPMPGEPEAPFA